MGEILRVGIEGLRIHSIHYTPGERKDCMNLHGHTFIINVEVEGNVTKDDGMVIDFAKLKRIVEETIVEYDHAFIVPIRDKDKIILEGPFNVKIKAIKYPQATTEYIALSIAWDITRKLNLKTRVRVYEGPGKYSETGWCNPDDRGSSRYT